jgi:hypothetical protein
MSETGRECARMSRSINMFDLNIGLQLLLPKHGAPPLWRQRVLLKPKLGVGSLQPCECEALRQVQRKHW